MIKLQPLIKTILAYPITKQPGEPESFNCVRCIVDARVFLKNTRGYSEWVEDARVLIGLYVEGGINGVISFERRLKNFIKFGLQFFWIDRWKDDHVWHPIYKILLKLLNDNGFVIEDTYWQPHWNETVCYVCARKPYLKE